MCRKNYVIWLKMIELQKKSGHRNICHLVMKKKKKVIVVEKTLLENKSKNAKEKWVNRLIMVKLYTFVKILLLKQFVTLI